MATEAKTVILHITEKSCDLAQRIKAFIPEAVVFKYRPGLLPELWPGAQCLIFIMAAGIVVRAIAPLINDKRKDPSVIVLDDHGDYVISLLSGHLGGGNRMAQKIAEYLGGRAVITTGSDVNNLPSIDLWARENNLVVEDWKLVPKLGTKLLNSGMLRVYSEVDVALPSEFSRVSDPALADVLISNKISLKLPSETVGGQGEEGLNRYLFLRPKNLVIGLGCNSGASAAEIEKAVKRTLEKYNLSFLAIKTVATIEQKGKEPGLIAFAGKFGFKVKTFLPEELNKVEGISKSEAVYRATGAMGVSEPAALLASGSSSLLIPKQRLGNVTVAAAESTSNY